MYGMPYRQLEGFTRALGRIVGVPSGDYTSLRKRVLEMDMRPFEGLAQSQEPLSIALDSTGGEGHEGRRVDGAAARREEGRST